MTLRDQRIQFVAARLRKLLRLPAAEAEAAAERAQREVEQRKARP